MTTETEPDYRRRRILVGVGVVVAVLLIAGGAFAWWFLRDDAPDEVSIDAAAAQVGGADADDGETTGTSETDTTAAASEGDTSSSVTDPATAPSDPAGGDTAAADPSGEWSVDTTIGEFSYEDSTGTFVGFRIEEELSGIGSTTAVGRTPGVAGTLTLDGTTVTGVDIVADMTAITTNDSRRDDNVQRALDTDEFPDASFTLTGPIELGDAALGGEVAAVDATGDLTIHGVTQSVTIPLEAQLVGDTIVVVGSLDITFADFGVEVPSAPIVVSAEDHGPLELQLFFTR